MNKKSLLMTIISMMIIAALVLPTAGSAPVAAKDVTELKFSSHPSSTPTTWFPATQPSKHFSKTRALFYLGQTQHRSKPRCRNSEPSGLNGTRTPPTRKSLKSF